MSTTAGAKATRPSFNHPLQMPTAVRSGMTALLSRRLPSGARLKAPLPISEVLGGDELAVGAGEMVSHGRRSYVYREFPGVAATPNQDGSVVD